MLNITKEQGETITYFDLFPLLRGLELERPGIKDRVWTWMCKDYDIDIAFAPFNGRISNINLFYYGFGPEYDLSKFTDEEEIEHSKKIHPDAFKEGLIKELRLDLNLILHVYGNEIGDDLESFPVMVKW